MAENFPKDGGDKSPLSRWFRRPCFLVKFMRKIAMMEEFQKINKRIDLNKCLYVQIFFKIKIKAVY